MNGKRVHIGAYRDDRTRPTTLRKLKSLVNDAWDFSHITDYIAVFHDWQGDTENINLLEGICANQ